MKISTTKKIKFFFALLFSLSLQLSFAQFLERGSDITHTNDRVGIKTNNPVHTLDIMENDYATIGLSHQGNGGSLLNLFTVRPDRNRSIYNGTKGSGNQGWRIMAHSKYHGNQTLGSDLMFSYWNDRDWKHAFVIDHATGRVGVGGVINPTQTLDVNGSIRLTKSLISGSDSRFNLYNNTNAQNSRTWIELWGKDDRRAGELAMAGAYIRFLTNSTTSTYGTESMRIDPNGNVGIGTDTPQSKLHVKGSFTTNFGVNFFHYESGWGAHTRRLWLNKGWNSSMGNYLSLIATGKGSNNGMAAMALSQKNGVLFGLGHDNADRLSKEWMRIRPDGVVRIGADNINVPGGYKLAVDGKAIVEELKVQLSQNWADYVFEEDYQLRDLSEVKQYVQEHKHLPGVPSAKEIEAEGGFEMGEMQRVMMEKIEELTLYMIDLKEENESLKKRVIELENK